MDLPSFKDSYGKITHASSHSTRRNQASWSSNSNLKITNVLISNSLLFINLKDLEKNQMESLDFHHTKKWERKSFIICGHLRTMELLITLWLVSVLPPRRWVRHLMLYSVDTTHLKSQEVLKDSNPLKTSTTGSEHGHLKDKE